MDTWLGPHDSTMSRDVPDIRGDVMKGPGFTRNERIIPVFVYYLSTNCFSGRRRRRQQGSLCLYCASHGVSSRGHRGQKVRRTTYSKSSFSKSRFIAAGCCARWGPRDGPSSSFSATCHGDARGSTTSPRDTSRRIAYRL